MYSSFEDKVKAAFLKERGIEKNAPVKQAVPFMEALRKEIPDSYARQTILTKTLMPIYKSLGTTDIAALRLVSISDRTPVKRNEETKFLNFLESQGRFPTITDYQYRIKERTIEDQKAGVFNMDATSLPGLKQSAYRQKYNTLTCVGDTLKVSFLASSIAEQQADVNLLEEQIDDEMVRIRRKMNTMLLANVEQISEVAGAVPQLGGFITRSTSNNHSASSGNLTNALLQTGVDDVGTVFGYNKQMLLWCNSSQIPVIDDLMINRYPGENSMTHLENINKMLAERLQSFNVPWSTVYRPRPGASVPVVFDVDMPANTAIMFAGEYPRMPRFKFDGAEGPFLLARPEPTLFELVLALDIFTLDDAMVESRVLYTSVA